jgi:hypothetical protein
MVGALALVVLLVLGAASIQPVSRPPEIQSQRSLTHIQNELAAGRPVTLVGDSGLPAWHHWRVGSGTISTLPHDKDRVAVLEPSWSSLALLAILPDPQCDHYRFEAELRQGISGRVGHTGVYWGCVEQLGNSQPEQKLVSLIFRDHGMADFPQDPKRRLAIVSVEDLCIGGGIYRSSGRQLRDVSFVGEQGSWRKIRIDVSPPGCDVFFEGTLVGKWSWDSLTNELRTMQEGSDRPVRGNLSPRGELGLIGQMCSVSFRRVVVTPLSQRR